MPYGLPNHQEYKPYDEDGYRKKTGSTETSVHFRGIPGFRSRTPWKMIVAALGYLLIFYFAFTLETTWQGQPAVGVVLWLNRLAVLGMCLSLVDLFTKGTGLYQKLSLLRAKKRIVRAAGYTLTAMGIVFLWVLLCVILVNMVAR